MLDNGHGLPSRCCALVTVSYCGDSAPWRERVYRSLMTSVLWTRIWTLLWCAENYDELRAGVLLIIICRFNVPVENSDLWLFPPCLFKLTIANYPSSVHQAVKNLVKVGGEPAFRCWNYFYVQNIVMLSSIETPACPLLKHADGSNWARRPS